MAEMEANFKAKRMPADSTRKATILPFELKKMDEKKKGGVIKKKMGGVVKKTVAKKIVKSIKKKK
jgi:hypothetical protein